MSTFGKNSPALKHTQNSQKYPPNGEFIDLRDVYRPPEPASQHPGGQTNHAYHGSPTELSETPPMRQSRSGRSGHENEAYVFSVLGDDGYNTPANNNSSPNHRNGIPSKDSITHNLNYNTDEVNDTENSEDSRCCVSRCCIIAIIVIVSLAFVVVGVVLGLFFGTDLIRSEPKTTMVPSTSAAPPLPDDDTFSGQLTLNQTWTADLANSSSEAFKDISNQFITLMDSEMSTNQLLGPYYNSTQVLSLLNGSIKVIFRMIFNEPVVREEVQDEVKEILVRSESSSSLAIVPDSLNITDFVEEMACGTEELMLCDDKCRQTAEIACNDVRDCSDYYDESNCPGKSVSCDFEEPSVCGYEPVTADGGYKWVYNSGDTPSLSTGPQYDHTFMNSTGHYYYTEWCQSCIHGSIARLISPWYVTREPACLSFYYSMKGHPTEMGPLYLYSLNHLDMEKLLWTRENPDADDNKEDWRQVKVVIAPGSYRFHFFSFFNDGSELSDKGIDDILVMAGECTDLPVCEETLYCAPTGQCLPPLDKPLCNGRFDCPDESDEENCPGMIYSSTFESGANLSSYSLSTLSNGNLYYRWLVVDGQSPVSPFGTYYDNTYRNELGHYATILPTQIPVGTQATLKVEKILPAKQDICLQFAYQMNYEGSDDTSSSSIKVFARRTVGGDGTLLWDNEEKTGREWLHESYSIPAANQTYLLEFVAVRGNGDGIIISIDDITIMNGFCPCADPGRRQCPDRTCIPEEWFCDGENDCSRGADENSCPACEAGQWQCKDKSCVQGDDSIVCDGTYNCADGSDEAACAIVDQCYTEDCVKLNHPDGLFEVCSSQWSPSLSDQVCTYLYKGKSTSQGVTEASPNAAHFLQLTQTADYGFISRFSKVSSCPGNTVITVICEEAECGRRSTSLSPYIIGGTETDEQGRWPWLVELKYIGLHICGGTLLTPHWVVTAAHCVSRGRELTPELLTVSLGTTRVTPGQENSTEMQVKRVVLHSDYINVYGGSDIALLFIEQPIAYTDIIKPACLADAQDTYDSRSYCFLAGWGKTGLPDEYPDVLQEAKYKLTGYDSCNNSWNGVIQDNMVCAGYQSGTIRSCQGDSGGPLMCLDKYQRWSLVGITSFGPAGCLLENHSDDVFTKASHFTSWINNIIYFEFTCQNGNLIKDKDRLCDGVDDCGDNSDEIATCVRSVDCSFELKNYCGYTLSDWSVTSGSASSAGSLLNTGPSFDHTSGLADGKHMYAYTSENGALLTSVSHDSSSESCLQFYFYLSYESKILISKSSGGLIAEVSGAADFWQIVQVALPSGDYSLVFEAIITQESYVGIDDVTVQNGACSGVCPSDMFKCQSDFTCIRNADICDGVAQCGDSSDESNCGGHIDEVKCSFDEPYACGFRQSNSDDSNWDIQYKLTGAFEGPSSGHIDDENDMDYSYLISTSSESYAIANVRWPLNMATTSCLTMWYYMYGSDVGAVSVISNDRPVWQEFGDQGEVWRRVYVPVAAGEELEIRTQAGKQISTYVAIDDVKVTKGDCPALPQCNLQSEIQCYDKCLNNSKRCDRAVDCFDMSDETSCGYTLDCDFSSSCDSYVASASIGIFHWQLRNNGHYLSVNVVNGDRGSRAEYTSAPLALNEVKCLSFKYQLDGDEYGNPDLRVVLHEPTIGRDTVLWRLSSNAVDWTDAHVTLSPADQMPVTVGFLALYGGEPDATLSLDDIRLTSGACSLPVCPNNGFLCAYEEKCIPAASHCNGIVECQGELDEVNCGALAQKMDCNFDESFCEWTRSTNGLSLLRGIGSTPLADTGPSYDNTQRSLLGYYLYLDSTASAGEARLTSPTIQLTSSHCFSFYYYMTGRDIGSLNLTRTDTSGTRTLMNINGAQGSMVWHKAKITLSPSDAVTLQFIFTSAGLAANTAIDDVTLRSGACDCTGDHQCSRSGECFDSFIECDFRNQCIDGSDEESCVGVCPGNDYKCATDGGCHPLDVICSDLSLHNCVLLNETIDCNCNSMTHNTCPQGFCYHKDTFCNGHQDCPDGSDELPNCGENCPAGYVPCNDKKTCVANEYWCEGAGGVKDCEDESDEAPGCVPVVSGSPAPPDCSGSNFVCSDQTQVLSRSKYCDGRVDCTDGSDEPLQCDCCPNEFGCLSGDRCISNTSKCDAVYDCPDFSDELYCNCSAVSFTCDSGLCLHQDKVCDGSLDCNDWSDETNCNCTEAEFRCTNGRCIAADLRCNNRDDCLDNSDEFDCPCSAGEVKCQSSEDRRCIPQEWKCDGYSDCHNGTDETGCGICAEYTCTDYKCINYSSVCDGVSQCADGRDESRCFSQAGNLMINVLLSRGQVTNNYTLCYDDWNVDWSSDMCRELGYMQAVMTRIVPTSGLSGPWVKFTSTDSNLQLSKFAQVPACESSYALALQCQPAACGEGTKLQVTPYLVGGDIVQSSSHWPWMVAIYFAGEFAGAGVHIGDGWVVTAAHLTRVQYYQDGGLLTEKRDTKPELFQVETVSVDRNHSKQLNVSKIIVHSQFSNSPGLRNDIALFKLSADITYPSLCLDQPQNGGNLCYVAGWGSVNGKAEAVDSLRDVRMDILPDTQCIAEWNSGGISIFYSSTMLCAGGDDKPSTCFGDSGGPLMCTDSQTGRWSLKGIVSFGDNDCVYIPKPNVFTEVTYYINWITETIYAK